MFSTLSSDRGAGIYIDNFYGFRVPLRARLAKSDRHGMTHNNMKPLSEITLDDLKNIKLLCFDADGVTVELGTKIIEKDGQLTVKTKKITDSLVEKLNKLKKHFHINISSGRSLLFLDRMYASILWDRSSIQGENGLLTLIDGKVIQADALTSEELQKLEEIKIQVKKLARTNENIDGFEPKQFMVSVHCKSEDKEIHRIVKDTDTENLFNSFWVSNESHDIFIKRFDKGTGLEFIAYHLGFSLDQTLAVGNGINDKPMLDKAGISITTDPKGVEAHYYTENKSELGGEEVVDRLLELLG